MMFHLPYFNMPYNRYSRYGYKYPYYPYGNVNNTNPTLNYAVHNVNSNIVHNKKSNAYNTNITSYSKNVENTNNKNYTNSTNNFKSENSSISDSESPLFQLFGISLYFDDILLICLIWFLYNEGVKDEELFISLILLLLS